MAIAVSKITLGIDVSKDELVVFNWDTEERATLENQPADIKAWLKSMYGPVRIAVEPTSSYHLELVEQAHGLGFEIYLINPRQLVYYRKAVGERNKTDQADAWLLARYLAHESDSLRPFKPQCGKAQRIWTLIKRRGVAVAARQKIQQSFRGTRLSIKALVTEIQKLIDRIDWRIQRLIWQLAWQADYQRCLSIPGIGPANAAALTAVFHRAALPAVMPMSPSSAWTSDCANPASSKASENSPSAVKRKSGDYCFVLPKPHDRTRRSTTTCSNNSKKGSAKSLPKSFSPGSSPESLSLCWPTNNHSKNRWPPIDSRHRISHKIFQTLASCLWERLYVLDVLMSRQNRRERF